MTPVRFYQDRLDRDAEDAFAARSTLSFGIQTLGATVIETSLPGTPTAKYFSWLGQAQYVRRIYEDWEILLRSDLQLANRPLFQMEQIALGGLGSVRGYRTYLRVTDDGFWPRANCGSRSVGCGSPISPIRMRRGRCKCAVLRFCEGLEHPPADPVSAADLGSGRRRALVYRLRDYRRIYYAKALRHVPVGTSIEDRGLYFRVTSVLF